MFALKVVRILLVFSLTFVFCSSAKSFLKGLILGSLLGHKKASLLHEKGEEKDVHYEKEYVPMPVHKEYVPMPVHEEPRYIPIYIVKECKSKKSGAGGLSTQHHIHEHNYNSFESDNAFGHDLGSEGYDGGGGDEDLDAKYSDGYAESRNNKVMEDSKNGDLDDNAVLNISVSAQKAFH